MLDISLIISILNTIILAAVTWIFGWLKPKKQAEKDDQLHLTEVAKNFLNTLKELAEHNHEIMEKFTAEQKKVIGYIEREKEYIIEKNTMITEITELKKEVNSLKTQIQKLISQKSNKKKK
jgi:HAMP domain-containing protein